MLQPEYICFHSSVVYDAASALYCFVFVREIIRKVPLVTATWNMLCVLSWYKTTLSLRLHGLMTKFTG